MRTRIAAPFIAAALLIPLAGCSSSTDAKPAAAPSAKPTTASPAPSPTPTTRTLGDAWTWKAHDGTTTTVAALSYKQPVTGIQSPDGSLGMGAGAFWGQLDVKVCNLAGKTITASQFPWHLSFADGTRTDVTGLFGGDFPKPEYPTNDTVVQVGDCLRGKIEFPVAKGQRPERIVYAPDGLTDPAEWAVPAK